MLLCVLCTAPVICPTSVRAETGIVSLAGLSLLPGHRLQGALGVRSWADVPVIRRLAPRAQPLAPAFGKTQIGQATFDATRSVIEMPFLGPTPRATLFRLSATSYYYELEPAQLSRSGDQVFDIGGNIAKFTVATRPVQAVVRLSFELTEPTVPAIRVDAIGRRIQVLPLGREVALKARQRVSFR